MLEPSILNATLFPPLSAEGKKSVLDALSTRNAETIRTALRQSLDGKALLSEAIEQGIQPRELKPNLRAYFDNFQALTAGGRERLEPVGHPEIQMLMQSMFDRIMILFTASLAGIGHDYEIEHIYKNGLDEVATAAAEIRKEQNK